MPNRILREGILTSERVNALDAEAEVFYRRLMSVVDDFGRFTAHPSLLRAALYPLKLDTVRDSDMERLLAEVERAGLITVYGTGGKRFLELLDFKQQVRAKVSKYPQPPSAASQARSTCVADAQQAPADAHLDGGGGGDGDVSEDVSEDEPTNHAHAEPDRFVMRSDWRPSEHLAKLGKFSGLGAKAQQALDDGLSEFVAFWLTQPEVRRSQPEWDHALIKSLRHDKVRAEASPGPPAGRRFQRTPTAAEQRVLQACPELAAPHLRPVATPPPPFIDNEDSHATPRIVG